MKLILSPLATTHPAEIVAAVCAGHVLATKILLDVRVAYGAISQHISLLISALDAALRRTRPNLAMKILPARLARISLANVAPEATAEPAGLSQVKNTLAVDLWAKHVIVLVFGHNAISEKLPVLFLHILATNPQHIIIRRHCSTVLLWT